MLTRAVIAPQSLIRCTLPAQLTGGSCPYIPTSLILTGKVGDHPRLCLSLLPTLSPSLISPPVWERCLGGISVAAQRCHDSLSPYLMLRLVLFPHGHKYKIKSLQFIVIPPSCLLMFTAFDNNSYVISHVQ